MDSTQGTEQIQKHPQQDGNAQYNGNLHPDDSLQADSAQQTDDKLQQDNQERYCFHMYTNSHQPPKEPIVLSIQEVPLDIRSFFAASFASNGMDYSMLFNPEELARFLKANAEVNRAEEVKRAQMTIDKAKKAQAVIEEAQKEMNAMNERKGELIEEGREEGRAETARNMLKNGFDVVNISKLTGLAEELVADLAAELLN